MFDNHKILFFDYRINKPLACSRCLFVLFCFVLFCFRFSFSFSFVLFCFVVLLFCCCFVLYCFVLFCFRFSFQFSVFSFSFVSFRFVLLFCFCFVVLFLFFVLFYLVQDISTYYVHKGVVTKLQKRPRPERVPTIFLPSGAIHH